MNRRKLARIADLLRHPEKRPKPARGVTFRFKMTSFLSGYSEKSGCHTAGCIAGLTCLVYDKEAFLLDAEISPKARRILELTVGEARTLFDPPNVDTHMVTEITAAGVIERFLKTGHITWPARVRNNQAA